MVVRLNRVPNTGRKERDRQALIRKLEANLRRFEKVPAHRREDECADSGEETCRALLGELGVPGYERPAELTNSPTLDEYLDEIERRP